MNVPADIKRRVEAEVKRCIDLYNQKKNDNRPYPKIRYDLTGARVGGQAHRHENWLRVHPVFLMTYTDDYIKETIPHEVAHLCDAGLDKQVGLVFSRNGRIRRQKRDVHGWSWKTIMLMFGANPNGRCHSYKLPDGVGGRQRQRHQYKCTGCGSVIDVGPKHHAKLQRGVDIFHKGCKGYKLELVTAKPTAPVVTPMFHKPKPAAKGTKLEQCYALYQKYLTMYDRNRMIELFVNVCGMTKAGASTYYYNCQKMASQGA